MDRDDARILWDMIKPVQQQLDRIIQLMEHSFVWTCRCGHTNGVGHINCAQCGRIQ